MDVTFSNVLEGTRQYFMGVPKPSDSNASNQPVWSANTMSLEEDKPSQSGSSANTIQPPDPEEEASIIPGPSTSSRPPSEPLEPEPHIIHKATVMREALEKRREQPEPDDDDETNEALSPPSHIIRKPVVCKLPSPAPAPAAPCPSPARPPSTAPPVQPLLTKSANKEPDIDNPPYRPPMHRIQTSTSRSIDQYTAGRPPESYSSSRPPEPFLRYSYETPIPESISNPNHLNSPQTSTLPRHSPQTYVRTSTTVPMHHSMRMRESPSHTTTLSHPPPINDRVPPIHHPAQLPPSMYPASGSRSSQFYDTNQQRQDSSHYSRLSLSNERNISITHRKTENQAAYNDYRMSSTSHTLHNRSVETQPNVQYKPSMSNLSAPYAGTRPQDRKMVTPLVNDVSRISRMDPNSIRQTESRPNYHYLNASTSKFASNIASSSSMLPKNTNKTQVTPKNAYDYNTSSNQIQPQSRLVTKPGFTNQQSRLTVSVTSLVNQMNQTKHKRESPLDLSVKTVKNPADSSTTQDDTVDSVAIEAKSVSLQPRHHLNSRTIPPPVVNSHKVDFAPDFHSQYRERPSYQVASPAQPAVRHNGSYESPRLGIEPYHVNPRISHYVDRHKYVNHLPKTDYVTKVDLTKSVGERRFSENKLRDDRHYITEERKRVGGQIVNNIPEKSARHETWSPDSRLDRINRSALEQQELMSRPVYSYSSHKRFEAYQGDQKSHGTSTAYRENRFPYATDTTGRASAEYNAYYSDKNASSNSFRYNRNVIQKVHQRDFAPHPHHHHNIDHSGVPADKRVLSILRNSLETKQGSTDVVKPSRSIPDLIVIDDVEEEVIEITDLTKDTEAETEKLPNVAASNANNNLDQNILMPKAVDSMDRETEVKKCGSNNKSPDVDVSARIRTKAELKVMPTSEENYRKPEGTLNASTEKLVPKSQKQHLFNQIREDNLRLESVIMTDSSLPCIADIKTEPMSIEEIEKDAIKSEVEVNEVSPGLMKEETEEDLDWATACDSFVEQLKTGCIKKKLRKKHLNSEASENKINEENKTAEDLNSGEPFMTSDLNGESEVISNFDVQNIKQEPVDNDGEIEDLPDTIKENAKESVHINNNTEPKLKLNENNESIKNISPQESNSSISIPIDKGKRSASINSKKNKTQSNQSNSKTKVKESGKPVIKTEYESSDDDEPLIKSKLLKEKEENERLKYQLLKDLSEKSAYVKLECFEVDASKTNKKIEEISPSKEQKGKKLKKSSISESRNDKTKTRQLSTESDSDDITVASRLRIRKSVKNVDCKNTTASKSPVKQSPVKKQESQNMNLKYSSRPGFGDGSDFHPGWEEELYKYKRSLRMPTRLIAIPRGRSGGLFSRGSTSLPDLDPSPLSPAPSLAPSAATDDLCTRRQDKHNLDSDLESNSSSSAPNRLHYDSEASTSTVFSSSKVRKKGSSIVDVLIQKCGKKDDTKKKIKEKSKEDFPKVIPKTPNELLPTPSLGLVKNGTMGTLSAKKEKLMEDIFYLGAFRKETVSAFRNEFITNTNGLMGATEEFSPVVLKSRTRTESRVLKQRATIKEVFGDERPASAPPISCRNESADDDSLVTLKQNDDLKPKILKGKKIIKQKIKRRPSTIKDGLRSTKSLKRNDAKGRLMRLKKRNNMMKSLASKRINKDFGSNKLSKKEKSPSPDNKDKTESKEGVPSVSLPPEASKKRFRRIFGRRKFSSGFDYIRKKKKLIRRDEDGPKPVKRVTVKPNRESVYDIHKEIKSWFVNKSIGETPLHRAARLGYTDCVAYCLEKMGADPSAKDNAGFTPLHVAAAKGHVRIARLLLQYGSNVSAAAQGGIRPLHEASENNHVEMIRLLLSYGADPLLGTYAGQTPVELAEGTAVRLLRLHIADVQGHAVEPWIFPSPAQIIDKEELGCDPLSSPPPASPLPPDTTMEIQCTDAPLPPFYSLKPTAGQPSEGLWCLLQDVTSLLQIKSKESLLKQIHCGSGSPRELLREIRTQEFLERAQCHQLLCAGEKVNVRASKVALVRVTDKLRQLLKIETVLVS